MAFQSRPKLDPAMFLPVHIVRKGFTKSASGPRWDLPDHLWLKRRQLNGRPLVKGVTVRVAADDQAENAGKAGQSTCEKTLLIYFDRNLRFYT
jgi:hypothetical protein